MRSEMLAKTPIIAIFVHSELVFWHLRPWVTCGVSQGVALEAKKARARAACLPGTKSIHEAVSSRSFDEQIGIPAWFSQVAAPGVSAPLWRACDNEHVSFDHVTVHVDLRIRIASFSAEAALTADLVPVGVDAILFWMVWDPKKACFEVENYPKAVLRSAQTAMRDVIGQLNLADVSMRRKQIDHALEEALGEKCEQWGITVMSVEIRDIMIPPELQNALSKEAQAERERNARLLLAEVEKDISEMFVEAADVYERNPNAMKLRAMNLAYEGAKDSRGFVLAPSGLANAFDVRP